MREESRRGKVIPRCYECGTPILIDRDLVYRRVWLGTADPWGDRLDKVFLAPRPFHLECWRIRKRREMAEKVMAGIIVLLLILVPVVIRLLR